MYIEVKHVTGCFADISVWKNMLFRLEIFPLGKDLFISKMFYNGLSLFDTMLDNLLFIKNKTYTFSVYISCYDIIIFITKCSSHTKG